MRFFSPETQRSTGKADLYRVINRAGITAGGSGESDLFEYLERTCKFTMLDIYPESGVELLQRYSVPGAVDRWQELQKKFPRLVYYESPVFPDDDPATAADIQPLTPEFRERNLNSGIIRKERELQLDLLREQLVNFPGDIVVLAAAREDITLVTQWCTANQLPHDRIEFDALALPCGFTISSPATLFITENELINCGFVRESFANTTDAAESDEDDPENLPVDNPL